jgi:hypothetical protein
MVFAYSSVINFYSPFKQARIPVWSNTALSPGTHVITIISTSIVPPGSSQAGIIYFSGFIVNGLIGAANVSTLLDFAKFSVFFGGAGFSLVPWVPTPTSLNRQIIGIYGCAAYAIGTTSPLIPCFYSYNPVSGAMTFYCPSSPSTSLDVVVTFTVLGPTI